MSSRYIHGWAYALIAGKVTTDPETFVGKKSGKAFVRFGMQVNSPNRMLKSYYTIFCFGAMAGKALSTVHKGDYLCVDGTFDVDTETWSDGSVHANANLLVMKMEPLQQNESKKKMEALFEKKKHPRRISRDERDELDGGNGNVEELF